MKKRNHPVLVNTKIQFKDGSIYNKKWLFFRATLPLEVDTKSQTLWKKAKTAQKLLIKTNADL